PPVTNPEWCRDPIDRFILSGLEAEGLAPAEEADRLTLIRRVALDLTGLPPTPEEADAFLADASPEAWERVVDRLLDSPRFGEHMAVGWLDLARYADTYGYQADVHREVWRWRDWVIAAFNSNLAYDDFATWQLAGDLLPDATREQRLATAFNRLHRQTNEGGSTEEEYRVEYVADRVQTFGTTFLGLSLECARCHDHKYDPLPAEDYYGIFAYFDDVDESGLYSHFTSAVPTPTLPLPTPEQELELVRWARESAVAEAAVAVRAQSAGEDHAAWRAGGGVIVAPEPIFHDALDALPANVVDQPELVPGAAGKALRFNGDDNASFPGVAEFHHWDPFSFALWINTPDFKERAVILKRSRAWTDAGSQGYELILEQGRLSWSLIHFWPGNAVSVRTRAELPRERFVEVVVTHDGSARAEGMRIYLDGVAAEVEVVRDALWKPITGGGPGALTLGERFRDVGLAGGALDELRVFDRALTPLEVALLNDPSAAGTEPEIRAAWLAAVDEPSRRAREDLRGVRRSRAEVQAQVEEIMVMSELPSPRVLHVLDRGRYDAPDPARPVTAHTPSALPKASVSDASDRLGLARWLTDPANPLASRVAVNRLWAQMFGDGLARTLENLGTQGEAPSHPELFDYLAVEFQRADWNVKAMLKRIAMSASYRQSSRAPTDVVAGIDERRLGRYPARRLTAEQLRDQALCSSGLLVERIGGPSVKPWQPPGLWSIGWGGEYAPDAGEGRWRRSLYTYWRRTAPPPGPMMFDAPSRDLCVARRGATSTPLQALLLLNDPQLVECSRALAEPATREAGPGAEARIARAFRLLCIRPPSDEETAALLEVYEASLSDFRADPAAADAYLAVGIAALPEGADRADLAALALSCSVLFAADASLTLR
ncbi:MAG: DUF1549 domain-containing protein, partial [Planctomycetota bacterium]|nr:DUF1549 domain-containing protein [Planctomycetota bacterium]